MTPRARPSSPRSTNSLPWDETQAAGQPALWLFHPHRSTTPTRRSPPRSDRRVRLPRRACCPRSPRRFFPPALSCAAHAPTQADRRAGGRGPQRRFTAQPKNKALPVEPCGEPSAISNLRIAGMAGCGCGACRVNRRRCAASRRRDDAELASPLCLARWPLGQLASVPCS